MLICCLVVKIFCAYLNLQSIHYVIALCKHFLFRLVMTILLRKYVNFLIVHLVTFSGADSIGTGTP